MAISSAWLFFFLCSLFLSHGVLELEASHHVDPNLQVSSTTPPEYQPYRTSYHFQAPKNWINGINFFHQLSFSFFYLPLIFYTFIFLIITYFSFFVFSLLMCSDGEMDKWVFLDMQILMVSSSL